MENIDKILDSLAARFGTTAEHVWEILVRQQTYNAFYHLGFSCLFFIISILIATLLYRMLKKYAKTDELFDIVCFIGFVSIVALGISIANFIWASQYFFNPEYYAMQEIFELIK